MLVYVKYIIEAFNFRQIRDVNTRSHQVFGVAAHYACDVQVFIYPTGAARLYLLAGNLENLRQRALHLCKWLSIHVHENMEKFLLRILQTELGNAKSAPRLIRSDDMNRRSALQTVQCLAPALTAQRVGPVGQSYFDEHKCAQWLIGTTTSTA